MNGKVVILKDNTEQILMIKKLHSAGDLVLKNVTAIFKACLGEDYTIGRYGGEEFIIILEKLEEEKTVQIVEKVRVEIMNFNTISEDKIIKVTCSFGVFISAGSTNLDAMIRNADLALYKSKNKGRNRTNIR